MIMRVEECNRTMLIIRSLRLQFSQITLFMMLGMFAWNFIGAKNIVDLRAESHINGLRLQRQLTIQQGRALTNTAGKLTQETLGNAKLIVPGDDLANTKLVNALEEIGGNISDWGKYKTPTLGTPSGGFSTHFYYNPVTNDAYYGMDYKSVLSHEGSWNLPMKPSFDPEPAKFNPY